MRLLTWACSTPAARRRRASRSSRPPAQLADVLALLLRSDHAYDVQLTDIRDTWAGTPAWRRLLAGEILARLTAADTAALAAAQQHQLALLPPEDSIYWAQEGRRRTPPAASPLSASAAPALSREHPGTRPSCGTSGRPARSWKNSPPAGSRPRQPGSRKPSSRPPSTAPQINAELETPGGRAASPGRYPPLVGDARPVARQGPREVPPAISSRVHLDLTAAPSCPPPGSPLRAALQAAALHAVGHAPVMTAAEHLAGRGLRRRLRGHRPVPPRRPAGPHAGAVGGTRAGARVRQLRRHRPGPARALLTHAPPGPGPPSPRRCPPRCQPSHRSGPRTSSPPWPRPHSATRQTRRCSPGWPPPTARQRSGATRRRRWPPTTGPRCPSWPASPCSPTAASRQTTATPGTLGTGRRPDAAARPAGRHRGTLAADPLLGRGHQSPGPRPHGGIGFSLYAHSPVDYWPTAYQLLTPQQAGQLYTRLARLGQVDFPPPEPARPARRTSPGQAGAVSTTGSRNSSPQHLTDDATRELQALAATHPEHPELTKPGRRSRPAGQREPPPPNPGGVHRPHHRRHHAHRPQRHRAHPWSSWRPSTCSRSRPCGRTAGPCSCGTGKTREAKAGWWPTWEDTLSNLVCAFLREHLAGHKLVINREVEI